MRTTREPEASWPAERGAAGRGAARQAAGRAARCAAARASRRSSRRSSSEAPDGRRVAARDEVRRLPHPRAARARARAAAEPARQRLDGPAAGAWRAPSKGLPAQQALLDGEVAVLRPDGTTSFQALQNWMAEGGRERTARLLRLRSAAPRRLRPHRSARSRRARRCSQRCCPPATTPKARRCGSASTSSAGPRVLRAGLPPAARGHRLEAARRPVPPGPRPRLAQGEVRASEQEFVIGGYTLPRARAWASARCWSASTTRDGRLRYAGKVGTGFSSATLRALEQRLLGLRQDASPFPERVPGAAARALGGAASWSPGRLHRVDERRPAAPPLLPRAARGQGRARGRRGSATASATSSQPSRCWPRRAIHSAGAARTRPARRSRARARGRESRVEGVRLTHPDRVLYPRSGHDQARARATSTSRSRDWILPHLAGRPDDARALPRGHRRASASTRSTSASGPRTRCGACASRRRPRSASTSWWTTCRDSSVSCRSASSRSTPGTATAEHLEQPDRVVFDLDPDPTVPWERVVAAARRIRGRLHELDLESFVKTTGGKGLHVVVPLQRRSGMGRGRGLQRGRRARRGSRAAGALPRRDVEGQAARPHLHRLAAQPPRGDLGRGLLDPRAAGRRRSRRRCAGRSSSRRRAPTSTRSAT